MTVNTRHQYKRVWCPTMAQLMSASSSMAPAPVRYTNRLPHTLPPVFTAGQVLLAVSYDVSVAWLRLLAASQDDM
jgi:hypothetical protein